MIFKETKIKGVWILELDRRNDDRGFFARSWCQREFMDQGLNPCVDQINLGFATKKATVRGLHFQIAPHQEAKTVRCTMGALFDVAVDIRPESPTFKQWIAVELTAENHRAVYISEGCAHGCQTLMDATEFQYLTTASYAPVSVRGCRFDDPAFGIQWPLPAGAISDADRSWPAFVG